MFLSVIVSLVEICLAIIVNLGLYVIMTVVDFTWYAGIVRDIEHLRCVMKCYVYCLLCFIMYR